MAACLPAPHPQQENRKPVENFVFICFLWADEQKPAQGMTSLGMHMRASTRRSG